MTDGKTVDVEPRPGSRPDAALHLLLGWCFSVLFRQSGVLMLHAATVRVADRCVLLSGRSGSGNSAAGDGDGPGGARSPGRQHRRGDLRAVIADAKRISVLKELLRVREEQRAGRIGAKPLALEERVRGKAVLRDAHANRPPDV